MFSGIVEAQGKVINARRDRNLVVITVDKPVEFDDLRIGDSICSSGVCLTVESFDDRQMTFALGDETLRLTGWTAETLYGQSLNLERSLRINDRIHGHMVSGHVDGTGEVVRVEDVGGSVILEVKVPETFSHFVWRKGSWAVNGVSLTINSVDAGVVRHCLIPETLRRTNLGSLHQGDRVNLEIDMMARGLVSFIETGIQAGAFANLIRSAALAAASPGPESP
jgi:riboflavin synthase